MRLGSLRIVAEAVLSLVPLPLACSAATERVGRDIAKKFE